MESKYFEGAVSDITGYASGTRQANAQASRARGAHVVLADINQQGLRQAEEQTRLRNPEAMGNISSIPTDVTNEQQVQALMRKATETFGRINLVVTCAGVGRGGAI